MKWQGRAKSSNVNDQRGSSGGAVRGGRGLAVGGGGVGLIIALVIFLLTGDPGALTGQTGIQAPAGQQQEAAAGSDLEQQLFDYAGVALKDIEDTWNEVLPQYGETYKAPTLTIYSGAINTGCGAADSGVGPFYCTLDQNIYLDLSFYTTLVTRYGATQGDFIMAYVIAHEAGHHVQTLLGVTGQLSQMRQRLASGSLSQTQFNQLSVNYELQADYLAGVVARHIKEAGYLEQGDLNEAMSAAAAVGDDSIQMKAQGYVDPDSFNHGTSQQRQAWFQKGYDAGDLSQWDTFGGGI
ncbi:MAG: neutral zinc metallopeptidase [Christensenellales bacterium]